MLRRKDTYTRGKGVQVRQVSQREDEGGAKQSAGGCMGVEGRGEHCLPLPAVKESDVPRGGNLVPEEAGR